MPKKLKKTIIIAIAILVVTLPVYLLTSFSLTEEEQVKADAVYGDIYNQQTTTKTNTSTTINGYNYANGTSFEVLDVEVKKTITKDQTEMGKYNIDFQIRGKDTLINTVRPTYVVFLVDKSYSMRSQGIWDDATKAVAQISSSLAAISGIQMAAVAFEGASKTSNGADVAYNDIELTRGTFSNAALAASNFGSVSSNTSYHGGTNMHAALIKARELLSNVQGRKFIIMISDGVPTFYYDEKGFSMGPGNSHGNYESGANKGSPKIDDIPEVVDITKEYAEILKNEDTNIYTIGYYLNKYLSNGYQNKSTLYQGEQYTEYMFAVDTIKSIATDENYYFQVDSTNTGVLEDAKNAIITDIATARSGYNVTITDNIGEKFRVSDSNNYGGVKELKTSEGFDISNEWESVGNFDVYIDKMADVGWYPTNNDFTVTYYDHLGTQKSFTVTEDPEVYWGHTLTLCKKLIGKGNNADFNFNITGNNYNSWIKIENEKLKANGETCQNIYLEPGEYQIKELIPEEYTLTNIEGLTNNSILIEGGKVHTVKFTNEYEKKGYYHSSSQVENIITNRGDTNEEDPI